MDYQSLALSSLLQLVVVCIFIAFLVFLFRLLMKLNKYLDRQLKYDCTKCEYKQRYVKDNDNS